MNADRTFGDRIGAALRSAPALTLPPDLVESCIDSGQASAQLAESQFRSAFQRSLEAIPRRTRAGGLNGVTGHISESVAELILVEAGWSPVEHFVGPFSGGHGIDLALLSPSLEHLVVVEVKGTLQPSRWPRLTRGEIDQMSLEWLSAPGNAGMRSLGLDGTAVSGVVLLFQFARRQWKGVLTADFEAVLPLSNLRELADFPAL